MRICDSITKSAIRKSLPITMTGMMACVIVASMKSIFQIVNLVKPKDI